MKTIELQLDIGLWQNKTDKERKEDLSAAILDFQRKPHLYCLDLEQLARLLDGTRTDHPIFQSEDEALAETMQWAAFGETQCLAWITTEAEGFYKTTRIILSRKYEEGGKVRIVNVAAFSPITKTQCLRLAEAFMNCPSGTFTDVEEIRNRPLEFNLSEGKSFPELVKIVTGKEMFELFEDKLRAQQDSEEVISANNTAINQSSTLIEHIKVGAQIELQLIARGHLINQFRDCPGRLNGEILRMLGGFNKGSLFDRFMQTAPLNPDKFDTEKTCAICHQKRKVWPTEKEGCDVCQECNAADNNKQLPLAA